MSLITEEFKPSINTLEEVKKLQELVRKLEIQNLHLRNKQNVPRKGSISPIKDLKSSPKISSRSVKESTTDNSNDVGNCGPNKDEYFDDLDIIRVSDIEMSDDESWLYTSPKSDKQEYKNESPYMWLRKDVDDPENKQMQMAKKALLTKLNELDILSPPNKGASSHAENPVVSNLKRSKMLYKTPISAQNNDSACIDTRTFTRSKKKQAMEFLEKLDILCDEKVDNNSLAINLHRRASDVSSDSVSSCHILEDASDVEEVARMQEESLRMSSPIGTPKRGSAGNNSSRKFSTSSRGSTSDQDISESSVLGVPTNEDYSGYEVIEIKSSVVESYHHSDQSSPSESPYSSNVSLHNSENIKGKMGGYRRSLPNLNREPLSLRQSKNNPRSTGIKQNQLKSASGGRKTDSYLQSTPKTRQEYASPSRVRHVNHMSVTTSFQSTRTVESITTVPRSAEIAALRARSGLPRPSRASSASRSGIPMPSMLNKKHTEDSWSEGCF